MEQQKTREVILERAQELFLTQGYHKTSMRGIAQSAGISTGPLYFHFSSKAEVFFHICRAACERLTAEFRRAGAGAGAEHTGWRLRNIYCCYKDFYHREPKLFEILQLASNPLAGIDLPLPLQEELDRSFARMLAVMEEIIEDGIARGELRPVPPRGMALYLYSVAEGVFAANRTGALRRAGLDLDQMIDIAINLVGLGIVNRPDCGTSNNLPQCGENGGCTNGGD